MKTLNMSYALGKFVFMVDRRDKTIDNVALHFVKDEKRRFDLVVESQNLKLCKLLLLQQKEKMRKLNCIDLV